MMPIARSRCGRRASSAWVEIESNPMYAKKIRPAPSATPRQPLVFVQERPPVPRFDVGRADADDRQDHARY